VTAEPAAVLEELLRIAAEAAEIVLRGYAGEIRAEYKAKDDPVTAVDREANARICDRLERAFPGVPIVAEESDPSTFGARAGARECFFVDPLDGTREFIARNGEFAVMIGLAVAGRATLGAVHAPAWGRVFAGGEGIAAFEQAPDGSRRRIAPSRVTAPAHARALVSRSRASAETLALLARLGVTVVEKMGGAGVKAMAVACGEADAYVHLGPAGKLWDACAPEAIVLAAGARYGDALGRPVDYALGPLDLAAGALVTATRELEEAFTSAAPPPLE
jgi:3'(2'), 5'-bisphosphate nucleotidase